MFQELVEYIKKQRQSGVSDEQIKQSLTSHGHHQTNVDLAFLELHNDEMLEKTISESSEQNKNGKKKIKIPKKEQPKGRFKIRFPWMKKE